MSVHGQLLGEGHIAIIMIVAVGVGAVAATTGVGAGDTALAYFRPAVEVVRFREGRLAVAAEHLAGFFE